MQWIDEVRIGTPEQIDVAFEVAGLGSRFLAQIIDWAVKWGLLLILTSLGVIALLIAGIEVQVQHLDIMLGALLAALYTMFLFGFDIYYEVRHNGQTPGKKAVGLRVVREGGAPVDFAAACIRNLLGLADFLPVFYLLGAFLVILSPRRQRLGDMAAGTIVIRERVTAPPREHLTEVQEMASGEIHFTNAEVAACNLNDLYILKSYFQRRLEMEPVQRLRLAQRLAEEFVRKTSYQPQEPTENRLSAETFLASLYRDLLFFKSSLTN